MASEDIFGDGWGDTGVESGRVGEIFKTFVAASIQSRRNSSSLSGAETESDRRKGEAMIIETEEIQPSYHKTVKWTSDSCSKCFANAVSSSNVDGNSMWL